MISDPTPHFPLTIAFNATHSLSMQISKRKKAAFAHEDDGDTVVYLTPAGLKSLDAEILRLDTVDRPRAVKDVSEAVQKGDLSENAEYQESRARLTRTEGRIFRLREKRKRVEVIKKSKEATVVDIGTTVTIAHMREKKTYEIVGPEETNPSRGRISFRSPLGAQLMGKKKGDRITITVKGIPTEYEVDSIE